MLPLSMIKPLGAVIKRLELEPVFEEIREIDTEQEGAAEKLGMVIISSVLPHIGDAADDIVRLIAAYKGISAEEAERLDAIEAFKELFAEPGIADFFRSARKSGMQKQ